VADIFMGGGTTIVEGARLGMQMYGNDLNPVAWLVVKNELAQVNPAEVKNLLAHIETEVKPQIMPFYACDCPHGHKGKWTEKSTRQVMGPDFDPLKLKPEERVDYEYEGPEVIYTFWCKHGPCQATGCDHRTPIMSSPVVAVKTLAVKAWRDVECSACGQTFDVEEQEARMAPAALFVLSPEESPYAIRNGDGTTFCPHCGHHMQKALGGKPKNKSIELTLLVHPNWLKGSPGKSLDGKQFGGSVTDTAEATAAWNQERASALKLIEVRGPLPKEVECPDTKETFFTDGRGGTVPKRSTFTCKEATCGLEQDVLVSVRRFGKPAPLSAYVVQSYCPYCDKEGVPLSGKAFSTPSHRAINAAIAEWHARRNDDLTSFWPKSPIMIGDEIGEHDVNGHHFTHWWTMFHQRQLLVHALLLKVILEANGFASETIEAVLGAFQQYLRNQNLFCFWNTQRALEPLFSDNHFHPKNTSIENSVFSGIARGDFKACSEKLLEAFQWNSEPWEIASPEGGHSYKVSTLDPLRAYPNNPAARYAMRAKAK
jgi:hypothetical protein